MGKRTPLQGFNASAFVLPAGSRLSESAREQTLKKEDSRWFMAV